MYFYVIKNLYEKNSQLLVNNQDVFKITKRPLDFRAPQEVSNGWFVESNIDSNSKFSILKKLLSIFELEDDLFIKYLPAAGSGLKPGRFSIRKKYWQQLLPLIDNTDLFSSVNASKDHWLNAGAGIGGLTYTLVITKNYVRIELSITTASKEKNKLLFKKLLKNKEGIEQAFGSPLVWEELADNKMSRIKIEEQGISLYNDMDWERMNAFIVSNLPTFEQALKPYISNLL